MKKIMLLCCLMMILVGRSHANFDVPVNNSQYYMTRGGVAACGLLATGVSAWAAYCAYKNHKNKKGYVEDVAKTQARLLVLEREIEVAEAGGMQREGLHQEWDVTNDLLQKKVAALNKMKQEFIGQLLLGGFCGVAACALFYFLYTIRIPKSGRKKIEDMYLETKMFLEKSLKLTAQMRSQHDGDFSRLPEEKRVAFTSRLEATQRAIAALKEEQPSLPPRIRKSLIPIIAALEDVSANDTVTYDMVCEHTIRTDSRTGTTSTDETRKYDITCHKTDGTTNKHRFSWDQLIGCFA